MQGVGLGVRGWVLNILGRFFLRGGEGCCAVRHVGP